MKSTTKVQASDTHLPCFHKETGQMALELGELSVENPAKGLGCNDRIALENKLRYQDFFSEDAYLATLLAYYGQAYKYSETEGYSLNDFLYADKRLWMTNFLYGLLRPLDLMHPYRLEGKTRLPSAEEKNIFDYWRPLLTDMLTKALKADGGILVCLTAEKFKHLFNWKRLKEEARVIHPFFMVDQGSRLKAISVYTKSCRGAMISYIVHNQLVSYDSSLDFELDGSIYQPDYGDEERPHFILGT